MPETNPGINPVSLHPSRKAFYILLCAILGAMLFLVLQRSAALIVYLLLNSNYQAYSLGLDAYQLQLLDWATMLAALFFGLWYGTWLGLHWYDIVYGQGRGGLLFHSFRGDWLRRGPVPASAPAAPAVGSITVKPAMKPMVKLTDRPVANDPASDEGWDLDDLLKPEIAAPKVKPVVSAPRRVAKPAPKPLPSSAKRKASVKKNGSTPTI
jgi:hypothetical protein